MRRYLCLLIWEGKKYDVFAIQGWTSSANLSGRLYFWMDVLTRVKRESVHGVTDYAETLFNIA